MEKIGFLTSRHGKIKHLNTYNYSYSDWMLEKKGAIVKFERWLAYSYKNKILRKTNTGFSLFTKIKTPSTQYSFSSAKHLDIPIKNTQEVSSYLSSILKNTLSTSYKQFLNENIFIVKKQKIGEFTLSKGFRFNIEVFASGDFLFHFFPVSKITSSTLINGKYLIDLAKKISNSSENMEISLIELDKLRRIKVDLKFSDDLERATKYIEEKKVIASFDYHFLSHFNKKTFNTILTYSRNGFKETINRLESFSKNASFTHEGIYLDVKPFKKFAIQKLSQKKNLLVGSNKIVAKQSAAYYYGCYIPTINATIQEIYIDHSTRSEIFIETLRKLNLNGAENQLKNPIILDFSESKKFIISNKLLIELKSKKSLVAIFTKNKLSFDYLNPLFQERLLVQIYTGEIDKYKIGNFSIKCLEKLGATLSIVNNLGEGNATYFFGIDLGHAKDFSKLGISVFNNKGKQIFYKSTETFKGESLDPFPFQKLLVEIKSYLTKNKLEQPKRVVIHRDGKNHKFDLDRILDQLILVFDVLDVDVLEIIKSGYPVFGCYSNDYISPESGDFFIDSQNKYSILATNIESSKKELVIKPIIIKHKYGKTSTSKLVEQIYWFTKIYTNNLYQSTRLPATTEKANNIVGTGKTKFISSYLG